MHLRSLALLVLIFGACAALAGYVGMMYGEQTPERAVHWARIGLNAKLGKRIVELLPPLPFCSPP